MTWLITMKQFSNSCFAWISAQCDMSIGKCHMKCRYCFHQTIQSKNGLRLFYMLNWFVETWMANCFRCHSSILIIQECKSLPILQSQNQDTIDYKASSMGNNVFFNRGQHCACFLAPLVPRGPFYKHGLTLIPAWISNYMPSKMWDEITYPFPNFNGCTIGVWE